MQLPQQRILIRNGLVLAADDQEPVTTDILIDGGTIAAVGEAKAHEPVDRTIDATGSLVVPGFINAHTHSPMNHLAGTLDRTNHPAFMWRNQGDTTGKTPREVYLSTLLGCAQMLLSGATSVIDHFPEQNFGPEDVEAAVQAYTDSGMRTVLALRVFDERYDDILPAEASNDPMDMADGLEPRSLPELRALCEGSLRRWHGHAGRISIFLGPSNPSRCSDALLLMCGELAEQYGVGIHTHLLETAIQVDIARRRYGKTMVEHLRDLGLLSPNLTCAHCNWLSAGDIELMARYGVIVAHNPESNFRLGSGMAPTPALLRAGAEIAIGTDGASHNDNLLLHEALRLAAIMHRPAERDPSAWIGARDVFRMATRGGARAMGLGDAVGTLAPGRKADLVIYDLSAPWWIPLNDPLNQLIYGENGSSVQTVLIDGRIVVDERRILAFDFEAVRAEIGELLRTVRQRNASLQDLCLRMAAEVSRP